MTLTWTTTNQGTAATGPIGWTDQLSVRNNTTGDQIASVSVVQPDGSPLAPGASVQRSVQITWPAGGDSTGDFSFVVTVDSTNRITEANAQGTGESNDQTKLDVLSAPDIEIQNLQLQSGAVVQAGGQLTLTWTDANTGTAATPNTWSDLVQIYHQDTGQQIVLVAVPANPGPGMLQPGGTLARSVTVTLPDSVAATGNLVVNVISDRDINYNVQITQVAANGNGVGENTQQIVVTSAAALHADLTASALIAPTSGSGGASINVGYTVTNKGVAATDATSWTDEIVFSPTAILNPSTEIVLGSFIHTGTLVTGGSYSATQAVTLPAQYNGTGYIALLTDPAGAVTEPARGTEYIAGPAAIAIISPYADLTTEAVAAPTSANDGDLISVSWRVRNLGDAATTAAGGWTDKVYLSLSGTVDANSILLGEVPHTAGLAVGASYTGKASFQLPGGITGAYRVLVVTDANGADYQGGRTANDTGESPAALLINAQPSPDLAVTAVSVPDTTVPGVPTTITFTVQNIGETIARGPWTDQLALLYGTNFASSSLLATVQRTADLAVGASYTVTETVTLPSLPDGPVQVAVTTDAGQTVGEAGRFANNTLDSSTFNTTHPELVPTQVHAPASAISGQNLTVTWTTTNSGTGSAIPGWTDTVTLVQGSTSTIIGTVTQITPLAVGASVARQIVYALPIGLSGAFQIVVTVDSGNAVAEAQSTKTDNTATVPFAITLAPYADLAVSNVTAPPVTIADPATVTIGWTVTNLGTGPGITGTWTDEVVVSASGVVGAGDNIVLASFVHTGALAVGASYTSHQAITLPPGFDGRYHLFVLTNSGGNGVRERADRQQPGAGTHDIRRGAVPLRRRRRLLRDRGKGRRKRPGGEPHLGGHQPGYRHDRHVRMGRQRLPQPDTGRGQQVVPWVVRSPRLPGGQRQLHENRRGHAARRDQRPVLLHRRHRRVEHTELQRGRPRRGGPGFSGFALRIHLHHQRHRRVGRDQHRADAAARSGRQQRHHPGDGSRGHRDRRQLDRQKPGWRAGKRVLDRQFGAATWWAIPTLARSSARIPSPDR